VKRIATGGRHDNASGRAIFPQASTGITVAVWIGLDDNHSLGPKETGGRVALPVFEELMLRVYRDKIAGPVPSFPPLMEQRITRYL
jgi:membrane carboxypeptidase/penicillin-binding protein